MALDSTGKPNPYVKAAPKVSPAIPNEKEKAVSLKPKDAVSVSGDKPIPMSELLKAQEQIDANNKKAGIAKEPLSRPRSKQTLPLANK